MTPDCPTRDPVLSRTRTREELILLLTVAAELEHALSCAYLFASFSLDPSGPPERQAAMGRWKKALSGVAIEEMLHLAQVANLLTAVGGMPHMRRPNFPQPSEIYPLGVPLELLPFSRETLLRFIRFELPEERGRALPVSGAGPHDGIEPFVPAFATIGELYAEILTIIEAIPEEQLFVGPQRAQARGSHVDFHEDLLPVHDRESARHAIQKIVEQGEGAEASAESAHFRVFQAMLRELDELNAQSPFRPARPVVPNPLPRGRWDAEQGNVITHPQTHRVAELFDYAYETLLAMLLRFFAHLDEEADLRKLAQTSLRLMTRVIAPLGESLTRLPFDADGSGRTAGPSFCVGRDLQLLPHRRAAFVVLGERIARLAEHAERLAGEPELGDELRPLAQACRELAADFAR
jgi:hypothetical protein